MKDYYNLRNLQSDTQMRNAGVGPANDRGDRGNGTSFEAIVRNSNRAEERLGDVLKHQATGAGYRQIILEGWQNAKKNSQ